VRPPRLWLATTTPRPQHIRHHLARVLALATTRASRFRPMTPVPALRGATTSSVAPLRQPAHPFSSFAQRPAFFCVVPSAARATSAATT
jgi:hypothetical protein